MRRMRTRTKNRCGDRTLHDRPTPGGSPSLGGRTRQTWCNVTTGTFGTYGSNKLSKVSPAALAQAGDTVVSIDLAAMAYKSPVSTDAGSASPLAKSEDVCLMDMRMSERKRVRKSFPHPTGGLPAKTPYATA